jgi:transcriptional regulator
MYVPEHFKVVDEHEIEAFVRKHDFATIVTPSQTGMMLTHLPVLVRREASGLVIAGHVSRANTHWTIMDGRTDSIVIFQGPHHYVSPSWYVDSPAVPTWNYGVVHAHGKPLATQDRTFTEKVLAELIERYESGRAAPWSLEKVPPDYYNQLLAGIVGFQMEVVKVEAKFKLGQNRRPADQAGTIAGLEREGSAAASSMAEFMRDFTARTD